MRAALCLLPLLLGCASASAPVEHDDLDLALYEGERVRLRSDLSPVDAETFVERLETIEVALDSAFPWLEASAESAPLTLIIGDPARYALRAQDHGVNARSAAFVCEGGELTLRYRPSEWQAGPPFPLEPRVRPLAAASLRRRLLRRYGGLPATWIEEGLAQVFVELAATALGETKRAAKLNRERVLDAFLPLFLGARPALARVVGLRGRGDMRRNGSKALAWAAARFLLADPELTPLLALAFEEAAGREGADERWDAAQEQLAAQEDAFEAFLRDAVLEELLAAYETAPTPVDRWESAAALRLIANIDLDPEASDAQRPLLARGARNILKEHPVPTRFLAKFDREMDLVLQSRSRLQAMSRLQKMVRRELKRRSAGYGHPAIEAANREMNKALDRALRAKSEAQR